MGTRVRTPQGYCACCWLRVNTQKYLIIALRGKSHPKKARDSGPGLWGGRWRRWSLG